MGLVLGASKVCHIVHLPSLALVEESFPLLVAGAGVDCRPASLRDAPLEVTFTVYPSLSCCLGCRFVGVDWSRDMAVLMCSCCSSLMEACWGQV